MNEFIKNNIVLCVFIIAALVYSVEVCASPIQEEQVNKTDANSGSARSNQYGMSNARVFGRVNSTVDIGKESGLIINLPVNKDTTVIAYIDDIVVGGRDYSTIPKDFWDNQLLMISLIRPSGEVHQTMAAKGCIIGFQVESKDNTGGEWRVRIDEAKGYLEKQVFSIMTVRGLRRIGDGTQAKADDSGFIYVAGISLTPASAELNIGGTQQLNAWVTPTIATSKDVVWKSSNPSIATVSASGQVTGIAAGAVEITATTSDGHKTASSHITVKTPIISDKNTKDNTPIVAIEVDNDTTKTIATFEPTKHRRIVTIGDFPTNHDPFLVLKKGQTITISLSDTIKNISSSEGLGTAAVYENIYDGCNHNLLIPMHTMLEFLYKVSVEQSKNIVTITVTGMYLDIDRNVFARFSNPPHCTTTKKGHIFTIDPLSSADMRKIEEESQRLREQLFLSPVISAELVFGVKSVESLSSHRKVTFSENTSGDRTICIYSGYRFNLQVKKDILFSGPFVPQAGQMRRLLFR